MGPLVSLPLQGIARYLPLLAGGAAVASQTDPKGLEYLKEGLSSLINPASYSLNPLEDILESKIEDDNKLINIPIDDIYSILRGGNLTSILNKITSTPRGIWSSPDQDDIDRQAEFNRGLGKQTTFADDIKSDPLITPVPEKLPGLLSTPEEKNIDYSNVTPMPAPPKVSDFIQKSEEDINDKFINMAENYNQMVIDKLKEDKNLGDAVFGEALERSVGDPNIDYREKDKKRGQFVLDAPYANNFWSESGDSFPGAYTNTAKYVLTYMKPGDFLRLAKGLSFSEEEMIDRNDRAFELYEKNKTGISIPTLDMHEDFNTGDFKVTHHEGRHRAKYFENLDPDKYIPVHVKASVINIPDGVESQEYIDYTQGSYTHGQSIANLGEKLMKTSLFQNEDGGFASGIKFLGYEGDGKKVEPKKTTENPLEDILESQIQNKEKETYFGTEEAKESFYDASNNIDVMFDIKELNKPENQKYEYGQNIPAHEFYENQYHGGVGDLGNADAFKKLKKLSYYPEYKKLIQESAKEHLGETFPAYRLVRGDMEAYRKGMPSLEKDINSYSLDPERALSLHNLIDYSEGLGKNRNNLVLQEVYINAKDLVMRGKEAENEIVVNTKKLDTDTVRVFDPFTGEMIKDATKGQLVDKELFKFSDKTRLGGKKDELSNDDDFIKF